MTIKGRYVATVVLDFCVDEDAENPLLHEERCTTMWRGISTAPTVEQRWTEGTTMAKHVRTLTAEAAALLTRSNRKEHEDQMRAEIIHGQQLGDKVILQTGLTGAGLKKLLYQCKKAGLIFDEIRAGA